MVKRRGGPPKRKRAGLTQAALGALIGIMPRQIRDLTARGMPRHQDGSYIAADAIAWYIDFRIEDELKRRPRVDPNNPVSQGLDHREQMARVLLAELRIRREEGTLVTTKLHRARVAELAQQFSAVIRSLPQYAPELVAIETMPAVTVVLERIANQMLTLARGEDEPAPTVPESEPEAEAEEDAA